MDQDLPVDGAARAAQAEHDTLILSLPSRPSGQQQNMPRGVDPVFIRDKHGYQRLGRSCIQLLQADGNYVELHTAQQRFVLRTSLRELIHQLGEDRFVQVNRSTAVNVDHLERVDPDSVEVAGAVITLSRSYRQELLERLHVLCGR